MLNLNKISGKAHYESHTWGGHSSPASKFFYTLIRILRFLSLLQIVKHIHRSLKGRIVKNSSRNRLDRKNRLDFHAMYTELYFITVMLLFIGLYILVEYSIIAGGTVFIRIFSLYFFLESALWIVYYMLFRILMERRLTIYNEAEYLIMFPVVVIIQLFTLSLFIPNASPVVVLGLVFNLGSFNYTGGQFIPVMLGMLGVFYLAAIIASLINILPKLPVWRRPNITVIGAGDVVINRILPSLKKLYSSKQIAIAADYIDSSVAKQLSRENIRYLSVYKSHPSGLYTHEERSYILQKIVSFITGRSSYAIIATPSDEHFAFIMALANAKIKFAVEKPICTAQQHLKALQGPSSELMKEGFLFSYYFLEKALPLNYLLTLNPAYRDLLTIETKENALDTPGSFSRIMRELGKETLIVVEFLEKDENEDRYWTELPDTGGMLTETFIHSLALVRKVIGKDKPVKIEKEIWLRNRERFELVKEKYNREIGPTYADMVAKAEDCLIRIRVGKYTSHKKRIMEIVYENGRIICDFDKLSCKVFKAGENEPDLKIYLKYKGKYETQLLLFHEFMQNDWKGFRYDDYPDQLDVINECLDLYPSEKEIRDISIDEFNKWLNQNLLFEDNNLSVQLSNSDLKFYSSL